MIPAAVKEHAADYVEDRFEREGVRRCQRRNDRLIREDLLKLFCDMLNCITKTITLIAISP